MSSLPAANALRDLPELDDLLIEEYTSCASVMIETLLEATDSNGNVAWHLVQEKHGVSLFRAEVGSVSPCNVHAVSKVVSDDISNVMDNITTDSTEGYRKMMKKLCDNFIDGVLLYTIVPRTKQHPNRFIGIKWASFRSASPFSKDKDYVFLEYTDVYTTREGQTIGFRVMQSTFLPHLPSLEESHKLQRSEMPLTGFLFYTTKNPNILKMTYTCEFEPWAELPNWAINAAIQSHVERCISRTVIYLEGEKKQESHYVTPQEWIPSSERSICKVCERNFSLIRHRHHCRKCGEVVCGNCTTLKNTEIPVVGDVQVRICTACSIMTRQLRGNNTTKFSKDSSTSSPSSIPHQNQAHTDQVYQNSDENNFSFDHHNLSEDLMNHIANCVDKHHAFSSTPTESEEEQNSNTTEDNRANQSQSKKKITLYDDEVDLPLAIERSKHLIETTGETNDLAKKARQFALQHLQNRHLKNRISVEETITPIHLPRCMETMDPEITCKLHSTTNSKKLVLFTEDDLHSCTTPQTESSNQYEEEYDETPRLPSHIEKKSPNSTHSTSTRKMDTQCSKLIGSDYARSISQRDHSHCKDNENLCHRRISEYEKESRCCLFGFY